MLPVTTASGAVLRPATIDDTPTIFRFIQELADYEKMSDAVKATHDQLRTTLFGEHPYAEVIIAEWDEQPVGMALFFHNYSTFLGKPGIHLEDLYVQPDMRGKGVGKALITYLAQLTLERGFERLEWQVLDWNEPARQFYRSLGARAMTEWITKRVSDDSLRQMAAQFERQS
ncbi:MAG: GNAT family N-acetyltransferase [Saccharospirillum sp.]